MILLSGHSLTPARRIMPERMSMALTERGSTAEMVPDNMTGIGVGSWFLDNTNPGKGIVWRVRSIETAFLTRTPRVELEHIIHTLKDRILFGEVTPATITGIEGAETCSALQAVQYILARQTDWVLGAFGYSDSNPYKFDGNSLYDALETVTRSLKDAWWSYDLTSYPFKLNITPRPVNVVCELRAGRNLESVTRRLDTSNMYTRFYPIGKDDLHIPGNFVSRNENLYGVIEHVEVNQGFETEAELIRWANERLDVHAQPADNIEINGLELADATGEPLDRLSLGRMCRVPLPEYGTTITEKITQLRYSDKIHEPEVVTVTLANEQEDIEKVIADAIKEGGGPSGGGGRSAARQDKEDHAWFEDTDTHVAMVAEGIVGKDADGNPDWARLSQIVVDGTGIHQTVEVVKEGMAAQNTRIDQTERRIILEANRATAAEAELSGKITVTANRIGLVVTERNGKAVVNTASIVAGINANHGSYIKLQADTINLSGYVTASELSATDAKISNLTSGVTQAASLKATAINAVTGFTYQNHAVAYQSVTIGGQQYHLLGYKG